MEQVVEARNQIAIVEGLLESARGDLHKDKEPLFSEAAIRASLAVAYSNLAIANKPTN